MDTTTELQAIRKDGEQFPADRAKNLMIGTEEGREALAGMKRSELLPHLFQIRGQAYSLDNYPQFRAMFDTLYVPQVLYMCGRQIGKSSNFSRSEILDCLQIPHFQLLYVAPLQSQTHYYSATYLREAIQTCELARSLQDAGMQDEDAGPIMRQIGHQSFHNGAGIKLTYAKTSSDRARGIYADRIDFDEIQDHLVDNIDVISQSLTQSEWGIRRFAGTAKTTDNTIEFLWQDSSQAEWVAKCEHCNFWNIPNMENEVWKMLQIPGPSCMKCGKVLNMRNGEFVPKFKAKHNLFAGYHIPQIVIPALAENPKRWAALIHKVMTQASATTFQEILGISCSVGARLITQADIDNHCTLPMPDELAKNLKRYVYTIGGVDWGVAEVTSFTVHTIIGVCPDGTIHVIYTKRFAGIDPDNLLKEIAQAHRFYGCTLLCADFGVGFDKNIMLAHRFQLPMVQIAYTAQNQLMTYKPLLGYPRWTVDKVTALEYLFWAIRYDRFLFPPKSESDRYTQDLLSPYEEIVEVKGIQSRKFLRNPMLPDDFCHALCFAYLGAIRLTNSSMLDGIPKDAMGVVESHNMSRPIADQIDPRELMRSAGKGSGG